MYGLYRYDEDTHEEVFVFAGTFDECVAFKSRLPECVQEDYKIYDDSNFWDQYEHF